MIETEFRHRRQLFLRSDDDERAVDVGVDQAEADAAGRRAPRSCRRYRRRRARARRRETPSRRSPSLAPVARLLPASQPSAARNAAALRRSNAVVARAVAGSATCASKRANSSSRQVRVPSTSAFVEMSNTSESLLARETISACEKSTCRSRASARNFSRKASQPVSAGCGRSRRNGAERRHDGERQRQQSHRSVSPREAPLNPRSNRRPDGRAGARPSPSPTTC